MGNVESVAPWPADDTDLAAAVAVYSGQRLLGWVKSRSDRFEAIKPDGNSIGLFNTLRAAWFGLSERDVMAR